MHGDNEVSRTNWGELAFGAFLLAVFAVWIWDAPFAFPAARRLPLLLGGIGVCLLVILAIQELRRGHGETRTDENALRPRRIAWCVVLTLAYLVLLYTPYFGYLTSTTSFVAAQGLALGAPHTGRKVAAAFGLAILVTAAVYVGFGILLEVPLPVGSVLP
jgi:hypothetical protein